MQDFVSGLLKEMETMLRHLFKGLWFWFIIYFSFYGVWEKLKSSQRNEKYF